MPSPLTFTPVPATIVVRAGGAVIAESQRALELREEDHAPVLYLPREDVAMEFLDPSDTRTTCPLKGVASHFSIAAKSGSIVDAAWSYDDPIPEAEAIRGYIAFYPEKAFVEAL